MSGLLNAATSLAMTDALMEPYDRLEASLTGTAATRRRLLGALIADALAPVGDCELEAAESIGASALKFLRHHSIYQK